jgi:hypothetical protein
MMLFSLTNSGIQADTADNLRDCRRCGRYKSQRVSGTRRITALRGLLWRYPVRSSCTQSRTQWQRARARARACGAGRPFCPRRRLSQRADGAVGHVTHAAMRTLKRHVVETSWSVFMDKHVREIRLNINVFAYERNTYVSVDISVFAYERNTRYYMMQGLGMSSRKRA